MSEEGGSRKVRKTGSPEVSQKSKVQSQKPEAESTSAPDSYRDDIPQSELNKQSELTKSETATALLSTDENKQSRKIVNRNSEIEPLTTHNSPLTTMEVHHHPDVEKKGFKEYILEGLMIFLAVTMGFFAESLREHIDNNEKGHEYVQSLLVDLKADTAKMNNYFDDFALSRARYKLLVDDLEKPLQHDTAYLSKFYDAAHYTLGLYSVHFTNRVVSQLKSSDNFRLIINNDVAGEITDYSNGTEACENQAKVVEYFTEDSEKFARQMINMKVYGFLNTQRSIDNTIALIGTNHKDIEQYANAIYFKAAVESSYCRLVREQKQRAIKLIMLLKREYNLNDE